VVSEGLYRRFEKEREFEGYLGIPLRRSSGRVSGHLALLSREPIRDAATASAIAIIFGQRAEAEVERLEHERERDNLLASLSRSNRRLANRHAALRQSNETRALLIGMMAHDLRNPLAVMLSRSELIAALTAEQRGTDPRVLESCRVIVATAERMDRMIASALVQAKSDAEAIKLDIQTFPAQRALDSAVSLNQVSAERKKIALMAPATLDITVRGDEDRLVEALDNLIRNAIKYSYPGQRVQLAIEELADVIAFRVADEGLGLTAEDCARAFRQYQRLSAKPTAGESSTGLGLAIVKTIAEAHGGTATVESAGRNRGAVFTITVPRTLV
jgi:signal transduction histidine kinase